MMLDRKQIFIIRSRMAPYAKNQCFRATMSGRFENSLSPPFADFSGVASPEDAWVSAAARGGEEKPFQQRGTVELALMHGEGDHCLTGKGGHQTRTVTSSIQSPEQSTCLTSNLQVLQAQLKLAERPPSQPARPSMKNRLTFGEAHTDH